MKPKSYRIFAALAFALSASAQYAFAQLNVPSDGSDGVLNITTNTVIDLSQAVTGTWSNNNTANAGKGVYDPAKWAVVFKYASVNIGAGATVTFANHPSHAPVVWLVSGDISISGGVDLSGSGGYSGFPGYLTATEPGPGGFRGGSLGPLGVGAGYGPGGVNGGNANAFNQTARYVGTYGNPQIIPLIGGSGGGAISRDGGRSGPSAGGAILIASSGTITLDGTIASGGLNNNRCCDVEYSASTGGAIRVVADKFLGVGTVGAERTRTEANTMSPKLNINPNTVAVPPGNTPVIWPLDTAPIAKVISVNSQASPPDPLADVLTFSDISISTNAPVDILIETRKLPPNGAVNLRVVPKYANYFDIAASYVSGTFGQSTWKATTAMPQGFCVLQAHATSP